MSKNSIVQMFNKISEQNIYNLKLPRESSLVNFSTFNELETDVLFRSFSVKYVVEGTEKYTIDGTKHEIKSGEFLLANNSTGGKLHIGSQVAVKGICIDIAPRIMTEVEAVLCYPDLNSPNIVDFHFFSGALYPEKKYAIEENKVGAYLKHIAAAIVKNPNHEYEFSTEFFYELATCIVSNQSDYAAKIQKIDAQKIRTKKRLFNKLLEGRFYIEQNYTKIKTIEEVARHCELSEFQFFRLFRVVFNCSPYDFISCLKLEFSKKLITSGKFSLSEIALLAGFNDLSSFSRAFKKHYGFSPSILKIHANLKK
ncbi:helix-turn-helix domain-containing protein [Flavobacterium sp.]|uniref:helix-turn-helix domain-containing protein n=1 Tax=Flavobacterium sp. TaxID=239 RepID=UPI003B990D64